MTDQNTETLPETIRWERRGVTLERVPMDGASLRFSALTGDSPAEAETPVDVSLALLRTADYRARVTVDGRSLFADGATPEEAMEAVDQQWERIALRQCPWLAGGKTSQTASMDSPRQAVQAGPSALRASEGWLEVQVDPGMFSHEVAITVTRPTGATESHLVPRETVDIPASRVRVDYWLAGDDCWVDLPTEGHPITVNRSQVSGA